MQFADQQGIRLSPCFQPVRIWKYIPPGGKTYKNSALPVGLRPISQGLVGYTPDSNGTLALAMSLPGRDRTFRGPKSPQEPWLAINRHDLPSLRRHGTPSPRPKAAYGFPTPLSDLLTLFRCRDYKMDGHGGCYPRLLSLVYEEILVKHKRTCCTEKGDVLSFCLFIFHHSFL